MMYKSQFRKIDPYDWFCGPGSHMFKKKLTFLVKEQMLQDPQNTHYLFIYLVIFRIFLQLFF